MAARPGSGGSVRLFLPRAFQAPLTHYQSDVYTKLEHSYARCVVWQFWGRAAEASWTLKSRGRFFFLPAPFPLKPKAGLNGARSRDDLHIVSYNAQASPDADLSKCSSMNSSSMYRPPTLRARGSRP